MHRRFSICLFLIVALLGCVGSVSAGPIAPVYTSTFTDCTTNQNKQTNAQGKNSWTISAGCDSYQNESYERPTTQTYTANGSIFSAVEYYENLDISLAKAGVDANYFYVAIDMVGVNHLTESSFDLQGLKYQYEFLLSKEKDGSNGFMLFSQEDNLVNLVGPQYQLLGNQGQKDTDGDVGGTGISVTKQDSLSEQGTGFDQDWIDDGKLKSNNKGVLYSKIDPSDPSIIEFALDYQALGFTQVEISQIIAGTLGYLDFRAIKGGPKDPQNYMWNDKYTMNEAGSPYQYSSGPCPNGATPEAGKSEFCTQGLGNLYELDTLKGGGVTAVPEPALLLLLSLGGGVVAGRYRQRR